MKVEIDIPDYSTANGIVCKWEDGFEIDCRNENGVIVLTANKAGLLSLANHFLNLAQSGVPHGCHIHFDANNVFEEGSAELIIVRKE